MAGRLLSFLLLIAFTACNTATTTPKPDAEPEDVATSDIQVVDVNQDGFNFKLGIPKEYFEGNEVQIQFNEAFGHLEVKCGDVFTVFVTEEQANTEAFTEKLKLELLMKYEVMHTAGPAMLYRQFLPDNSMNFWHVYVGVSGKGTQYLVRDISMTPLNEFQARKIYNALQLIESES
jgi:hypothetical protein